MKKTLTILAISGLFLITSCSSGWSCKSSYCKTDKETNTEKSKEA